MTTRPVGRPRKNRVKIGTTIRQEDADLLKEKVREGVRKNKVVDAAFDALRGGEDKTRATWFDKGVNAVRRRNKSGCCCIVEDDGTITSACAAHVEWRDAYREKEGER